MEKIFEIPGITYDPVDSFRILDKSEAEQDAFYAMQEKQDQAILDAWKDIVVAIGFRACEFVKPSEYPITYILHPSTRGYKWQLSRIAYDGIPVGHTDYSQAEVDSGKLYHDLKEETIHGAKVRVIFDGIL